MTVLKVLMAMFALLLTENSYAVKTVGKSSSKVTATVIFREFISVTAPGGSRYNQPQELVQWGAMGSPYSLDLPLVVEGNVPTFLVSLDAPVEMVNQANSAQHFQDVSVSFGNETHPFKALTATPELFSNATTPTTNETFLDTYQLKITAKPPEGSLSSTTGNYLGTLALTFEPMAVAP
jgi:hypothetical protein